MKSPWMDQKSARASASSVGSAGGDSPDSLDVLHWDLHSLRSVPALEWVLGIRSLSLTVLLYHLLLGKWINPLLVLSILQRWFFEDKYLMHPIFSNLQICNQNIPFPNSFRDHSYPRQERKQIILSCQKDEMLIDLALKSDDIQPLHQRLSYRVSRLPGSLGHLADGNSIPQNLTNIFHPILILAMLLKYPFLLVKRLFQRCHLSHIYEV